LTPSWLRSCHRKDNAIGAPMGPPMKGNRNGSRDASLVAPLASQPSFHQVWVWLN